MQRPLRTRLDLLRPSVSEQVTAKQLEQQKQERDRNFELGQLGTSVRDRNGSMDVWSVRKDGPVSKQVEVGSQVRKHHTDQLLPMWSHQHAATEPALTVESSEPGPAVVNNHGSLPQTRRKLSLSFWKRGGDMVYN